ncbi:hypothetical protein [Acetonema longum]|uniref:Uncharacterized protein n=1 Tax=Acetonema longum DSM 6540 TaxID=1009370 RepID=F7NL09_9FIRM|nr:hypothetical protein [Acetonema longum]EGO63274.1 hypothetical protein ALO_13907 [Acetonema longum DSM 6540]
MIHKIDITDEMWDIVDFFDARIFMNCPRTLGDSISFGVWGVTLINDNNWLSTINVPLENKNAYLAGMSRVLIDGVVGGKVEIALYDQVEFSHFIQTAEGKRIDLNRSWNYEPKENLKLYEWDCVFDWPCGYAHLELAIQGKMFLEFDTDNVVIATEYVMNPQKYSYPE